VVFDTNVYISAYAFGGVPGQLMRAAITGTFELVTSPALLAEVARVLTDKLDFDREYVEAVVRQIARVALVVRPEARLSVIADEPDNRVLEYAVESRAELIVSGDHHLLSLGEYEGARVAGIAEAISALG
jgi:putative PIN family toxin of toxin-antitoxin system